MKVKGYSAKRKIRTIQCDKCTLVDNACDVGDKLTVLMQKFAKQHEKSRGQMAGYTAAHEGKLAPHNEMSQ